MKFQILIFLFFFSNISFSKTTVYGIAPSYKGESIQFYKYSDLITYSEEEFFKINIDSVGKFETNLEINETNFAFCRIGIFRCVVYIEPNKNCWFNFPVKTHKSIEDELNPYFKESDFFLGINDTTYNDLNYSIKKFDDEFDDYLTANFFEIYRNAYNSKLDSSINIIENKYKISNNKYFNNYRKYKYAYLRNISYQRDVNFATKEYFKNQEILYNNLAYMELFNHLFSNFFSLYSKSNSGKKLAENIILAKSIKKIKETLVENIALQDENLIELIILKSLHDAYYFESKGDYIEFPKFQIKFITDSIVISSQEAKKQQIAKNIKAKFNNLAIGTFAPDFELHNINDKIIKLSEIDDKFIYLNFIHIKSLTCQEDLKLISDLYKKYKKNIYFVTIALNTDFYEAKKYFDENDYKWTLLDGNMSKNLKKIYNVKTYPIYYFLSDQRKFLMSPSPSPKENFENIYLKNFKSREFRTQKDYDDLIYDPTKKSKK